jgi:hypothetical protein
MNRKIIQISTSNHREYKDFVYALCDDGSVWLIAVTGSGVGEWVRLPDIKGGEND